MKKHNSSLPEIFPLHIRAGTVQKPKIDKLLPVVVKHVNFLTVFSPKYLNVVRNRVFPYQFLNDSIGDI